MDRKKRYERYSWWSILFLIGGRWEVALPAQQEEERCYLLASYNGGGMVDFFEASHLGEDSCIDTPDKEAPSFFGAPSTIRYFGVKQIEQSDEGIYSWYLNELKATGDCRLSMEGLLLLSMEDYAIQKPTSEKDQLLIAWQSPTAAAEAKQIVNALKLAIKGELADHLATTPRRSESPGAPLLRRRSSRKMPKKESFPFPSGHDASPALPGQEDSLLASVADETEKGKKAAPKVVTLKPPVEKGESGTVPPSSETLAPPLPKKEEESSVEEEEERDEVASSKWRYLFSLPLFGGMLAFMQGGKEEEEEECLVDRDEESLLDEREKSIS